MFLKKMMRLGLALVMLAWLSACQKTHQQSGNLTVVEDAKSVGNNGWKSPDVVMAFSEALQKAYTYPDPRAVPGPQAPPPTITRPFAMIHVAMHDALNCVKSKFETYAYHEEDHRADAGAAVAQAAYETALGLGNIATDPAPIVSKAGYSALLTSVLAGIPDGEAKQRGIDLGKKVAAAILAKRNPDLPFLALVDPAHAPANGTQPGEYRYLPPLNYALPRFHLQQTWAISSNSQFRSPAPYVINSPAYTADFDEVKSLGRFNSTDRSKEQTEIGVFWAENSSRGWNAIALDIIRSRPGRSMDAWKTARVLALMHIALADAYIAVFDGKVFYNYWRPISAITLADTDGNDQTVGDVNWKPELNTPAVGEYPSAHAMSGAAAGEVLIRLFGNSKLPFTTSSGYLPSTFRSYQDMRSAIRDNSLSRIYIGFHFRKAVDEGQKSGYSLGDWVYEHALREK